MIGGGLGLWVVLGEVVRWVVGVLVWGVVVSWEEDCLGGFLLGEFGQVKGVEEGRDKGRIVHLEEKDGDFDESLSLDK